MKLGFDSNVVAASMSQFQLEQSSVIKTAPPGRQLEFSPKNEPIDLAPLTQSNLQDLSKMQPIDLNYYNTNYQRAYEYAAIGLGGHNQSSLIPTPSTAGQLYYGFPNGVVQQDWGRPMDTYTAYPRATTLQYNPQENQQERVYKGVDMPSPVDSGIGADLSMIAGAKEEFFQSDSMLDRSAERALSHRDSPVVIPKLHNPLGFQYVLEAPISTSIRKEDDRMTYVNKGQFYTVSLDYIPDINKPLKSVTVKSQLMIVFREDKTYEEEIKTWQFWHSRQHSAKQRILEVDSKNSSGMIGQIEEIAHNAVQFYWNPSENGVKVSPCVYVFGSAHPVHQFHYCTRLICGGVLKVGVGKRGRPQPLTSPLDFTQPPAFCGH
ncbi:CP2 transcription factor [Oesophagostomum dentatum]|uniref:CP2 transcription factor n=1 Tax=Oesophagostomum dentatum TaxID=61180 RepID=A0A0B1T9M3_OESDE|nr:CP2 transcription factor [Oesophagostomum dentatum]